MPAPIRHLFNKNLIMMFKKFNNQMKELGRKITKSASEENSRIRNTETSVVVRWMQSALGKLKRELVKWKIKYLKERNIELDGNVN